MITKKSLHTLMLLFLCNTCTILQSMRLRPLRSLARRAKSKIKILKLGGSIITDKSAPIGIAKTDVIDCIAKQIALYDHPVILTHGTGSFGHPIYHAYNLENEFNLEGTIKAYKAEKQLNNIVIDSLHRHGINAICIDPMHTILCEDGNIKYAPIELIKQLLALGITTVLFGTMVKDKKRIACSLSSDKLTTHLAEMLHISATGFGSSEYGVYDMHGSVIPEINPVNFEALQQFIGGSEHTDTTGGMLGKVQEALEADSLTSFIFNGKQEDNVSQFLHSEDILGTKIVS